MNSLPLLHLPLLHLPLPEGGEGNGICFPLRRKKRILLFSPSLWEGGRVREGMGLKSWCYIIYFGFLLVFCLIFLTS